MSTSDFEAIQNLKARYCAAGDSATRDREAAHRTLCALFTDDVVADYGFGEMRGGEAIGVFLSDAIGGGSEWMVHNIHTPLIDIDGDRATGSWTVNVRMKRTGTGNIDFVFGRYADEFVRTPTGWKIARVEFTRYE